MKAPQLFHRAFRVPPLTLFWFLLLSRLSPAQEIPDTIWGLAGSDTVSLSVQRMFAGGWSVLLLYKAPTWREVARETLSVDTLPRLLQWVQYCQPPFDKPCHQVTFTYVEGRLYATHYRYAEPIFVPLLRTYAWGLSHSAADNLLFSPLVEGIWPGSPDTLHPVWPFPRGWRRAYWPDSTLTEVFDPTYQVFIEAGGRKRLPVAPPCDSTHAYEGAEYFPVAVGTGTLCFPDGERLVTAYDSLCDSAFCWITQRVLSYAGGLPLRDTLRVRQVTATGQPVGSGQWVTRYQYDPDGRLVEVIAPARRYRLSYSGQVLSIPLPAPAGPLVTYSSTARWVHLENLPHPATMRLYNLAGNLIWVAEGLPEGTHPLPLNLQGAYLIQVSSPSGFIWQRLILLP